jgi:hypothetical protein
MYKISIAITAVLAASMLAVVAITTPFANAQSSETETGQELKQKIVTSGDSDNFQCGQNSLNVETAAQACEDTSAPE